MKAIENVDPKDLVAQAEAELIEAQTKSAVQYLKGQIEKRDKLRDKLAKIEVRIAAISTGDWSLIGQNDDEGAPSCTTSSGYYHSPSTGLSLLPWR